MALDGEPRNGDFAAYIEERVSRGAPGEQPRSGAVPPAAAAPAPIAPQSMPGMPPAAAPGRPLSMAEAGSRAVQSLMQKLVAALFFIGAVASAIGGWSEYPENLPANIVRTLFPLVFSILIFTQGRRSARKARDSLKLVLPPFVPPSRPSDKPTQKP